MAYVPIIFGCIVDLMIQYIQRLYKYPIACAGFITESSLSLKDSQGLGIQELGELAAEWLCLLLLPMLG